MENIISDVKIKKMENASSLKAFATVIIANNYACKGFKVMDGQNGLWVSMPSKLNKTGQWNDIFHPISAEGRTVLFEAILNKYNKEVENNYNSTKKTENNDNTDEEIPF